MKTHEIKELKISYLSIRADPPEDGEDNSPGGAGGSAGTPAGG